MDHQTHITRNKIRSLGYTQVKVKRVTKLHLDNKHSFQNHKRHKHGEKLRKINTVHLIRLTFSGK